MIAKLKPTYKEYIWGGTALQKNYGKNFEDAQHIAETWELSCQTDGLSVLAGGTHDGTTLAEYLKAFPEALGSAAARFEEFPLLIKLIDAAQSPAVQVHPDNAYAAKHGDGTGKTKAWHILSARPGAFVYYGVQSMMTRQELAEAIRTETVCERLKKIEVEAGDTIFIEPGTIHGLCEGIIAAEIQQAGSTSYRLYNYRRTDEAEGTHTIELQRACEAAMLHPSAQVYDFEGHLARCKYFTTDRMVCATSQQMYTDGTSFHSLLILDGTAIIECGADSLAVKKGDSIFVSADSGKYVIKGDVSWLFTRVEKQRYRIGIDLGGTGIKAGVVDEAHEIVATAKRKTRPERPWQEVIHDMGEAALDAVRTAGLELSDCISVGIGSPGAIDSSGGIVVQASNLNWNDVPLEQELKKYLPLPMYISNDANCAALGEVVAGAAKGCKSAVLLTLGTGVGGGIVIDGRLFEGGIGGVELGHITLIADGEPCTCGRKGCLESYASATALIREAGKAADADPESILAQKRKQHGELTGLLVFEALNEGDHQAQAVVKKYIEWLGEGITNYVNIFRPEMVLISGGICGQGTALTDPLNHFVKQYSFSGSRIFVPPIIPAKLGNDAGIIGAAALG